MTPYYLSRMFTIKHMSETRDFNTLYDDKSTTENWTAGTTGGIMTNSISGDLTIGGRGSNDNFHGKIASMVVNTLKVNQILPDDVEIAMMINDPMKWVMLSDTLGVALLSLVGHLTTLTLRGQLRYG